MTEPFPIPRQLRQTDVFVGDGGAIYSGFSFKIFDIADVEAWTKAETDTAFIKQSVTVAKLNNLPFDDFSVTFSDNQASTIEIIVRSARLAERSAGVDNGTRLDMNALEKELSKQATVQQEVRRDLGRTVMSDFGETGLTIDVGIPDGRTLMKQGGRLQAGPDIVTIGAAAEAAKDLVEGWVGDIVSQGNVPIYGTVQGLSALTIPLGINAIRTNGFAAAGDLGGWPLAISVANTGPLLASQRLSNLGTRRWQLSVEGATPRMFGAKGDGAAVDTSAIGDWLAYIAGGSGMIGTGTYIDEGNHTIASNTRIFKMGTVVFKLKDNCSPLPASMFRSAGTPAARSSNIVIEDIIFDGNRQNNINHGTPDVNGNQSQGWEGLPTVLVSIQYCDGVDIHGCTFQEAWAGGLWVVDCQNANVYGNTARNCRKGGISVRRTVPLQTIGTRDVKINDNHAEGCTIGIHSIFGNSRVAIGNNTCKNNKDANAYPSFAWNGVYPNVWPNAPGFKAATDPGYVSPALLGDGAGIELTGYYTVPGAGMEQNISITGNLCASNAVGIRAEQAAQGLAITGNVCSGNDSAGIYAYSAQVATISANVCFANQNGIVAQKATSQIAPSEIAIGNNICRQNKAFGFVLMGVLGGIVKGNISIDNNQNAAIDGGFILLVTADGQACDGIDIEGNRVSENGHYWLFGDGTAANVKVRTNSFNGSPASKVSGVPAQFSANKGYVTSGKGNSSVGQDTFISVPHGLNITPDFSSIRVTPGGDLGANGRLYVNAGTITSTKFDVVSAGGPTGSLLFGWEVVD
jgi:nitrous oxidase accessory protein NosD